MKLQSVQVLRGLAALLVVTFHIGGIEQQSILSSMGVEKALVGGLFANGFAGVDLFFVISGFIMVYVTHGVPGGLGSASKFLFSRTTRIYPLWWLCSFVLGAYMIAMYGWPSASDEWRGVTGNESVASFFVKSFLLIPQSVYPMPSVGWTLIHELYFYLVFALFLAFVPRIMWPLALLGWATAVIAGAASGLTSPITFDVVDVVFHPMTLEFVLGAIAGQLIVSSLHWRPGLLLVCAGFLFAAALCLHGAVTNHTLLWARVIWFGIPCAVLVYAVAALDITSRSAWLVPAGVGFFSMIVVFQAYSIGPNDEIGLRAGATLVALIVGALSTLATLWIGWLGGQFAPEKLTVLARPMQQVHGFFASIGEWSYSLYLTHIIVLSATRLAFEGLSQIEWLAPTFRLGHAGVLDNVAFAVIGLTMSIVAAKLTYVLFEHPTIKAFALLRTRLFNARSSVKPI